MARDKKKTFRNAECFGREVPIVRIASEVMGENAGAYDPNHQAIAISDDVVGMELEKVLMHEMFHATLDRLYLDAELDRLFVETLIENLVTMVFDNWKCGWKR